MKFLSSQSRSRETRLFFFFFFFTHSICIRARTSKKKKIIDLSTGQSSSLLNSPWKSSFPPKHGFLHSVTYEPWSFELAATCKLVGYRKSVRLDRLLAGLVCMFHIFRHSSYKVNAQPPPKHWTRCRFSRKRWKYYLPKFSLPRAVLPRGPCGKLFAVKLYFGTSK